LQNASAITTLLLKKIEPIAPFFIIARRFFIPGAIALKLDRGTDKHSLPQNDIGRNVDYQWRDRFADDRDRDHS
jgi:hypothetical protein